MVSYSLGPKWRLMWQFLLADQLAAHLTICFCLGLTIKLGDALESYIRHHVFYIAYLPKYFFNFAFWKFTCSMCNNFADVNIILENKTYLTKILI